MTQYYCVHCIFDKKQMLTKRDTFKKSYIPHTFQWYSVIVLTFLNNLELKIIFLWIWRKQKHFLSSIYISYILLYHV